VNSWVRWALRVFAILWGGASAYEIYGSRYGDMLKLALAAFFGLLSVNFSIWSVESFKVSD